MVQLNIRLPTKEDGELQLIPAFDYTKLVAINTCNRWGIIRYGKHLSTSTTGRSMALEAGHACHEVFAATRLFDLCEYAAGLYPDKNIRRLVTRSATRLFGEERANEYILRATAEGEDVTTRAKNAGLYILETTGFYDDPQDKRRTMQKLSEACTAFIDRYSYGKSIPYISMDDTYVGVESPFELIAEYTLDDGRKRTVRFYGRIDGVSCYRNDPKDLIIEEYKTASRLNDAWIMSFETTHQVTGYMVAARMLLGAEIDRARVVGLSIPLPVRDGESVVPLMVKRGPLQFEEWARWFIDSVEMYFTYIDVPFMAPMMTGQCNRYFRPCAFIPLCAARDEEERDDLFSMLEVAEWSPLDEKASD